MGFHGLQRWRRFGGPSHRRVGGLIQVGGESVDGLAQLLGQVPTVRGKSRLLLAIHPPSEPHLAEHHLRARGEVFVHRNRLPRVVRNGRDIPPRRGARRFAGQPFAEEDDVGGDLGVGVLLEGVVR